MPIANGKVPARATRATLTEKSLMSSQVFPANANAEKPHPPGAGSTEVSAKKRLGKT